MDKRYDNVYNLKFVLCELIRKNRFSLEYINELDLIIDCLFNINYLTVGNLDEKQTFILRERFGINNKEVSKTLEQLSKQLNITTERIRQLELKSLVMLLSRIKELKVALLVDELKFSKKTKEFIFNNNELNYFGNYFKILNLNSKSSEILEINQKFKEYLEINKNNLKYPIEVFNFIPRTYNALKRADINNLEEILSLTKEDILKIRYIGVVNYNEIKEKINLIGYDFKNNNVDNKIIR